MPGRMGASPFPWIQRHDLRMVHVMASWRNGYLREYIGGVLNYEDATNVMYTRNYQTYYSSTYNMGLPGMFRYVRIWNYAKNFDLDKFVPDT